MKNFILTIIITTSGLFNINAQNTNIITGLQSPRSITFHGNNLYIFQNSGHKLSKYDITSTPISGEIILDDVTTFGNNLAIHGNDLYFTNSYEILKFDVTEFSPNLISVYTAPELIGGIKFNGDDLYFYHNGPNVSEQPNVSDQMFKFDVTESTNVSPELVDFTFGSESFLIMREFTFINNILYFATSTSIYSVDLIDPSPVATLIASGYNVILDLESDESNLFALDYADEKLIKIDVTSNPIMPIQIQDLHPDSRDMAFHASGDLYVAKVFGTVYKFNSDVLGINEYQSNLKSTIFPNPSHDFISLSNIPKSYNFKIFNILGMEISDGLIEPNDKIDIRNLRNGMYLLILENGYTQKFVKN